MALYISKHWSVTEWDCLKRAQNDYAWDNEEGKLCTDNEKTANLFRILDTARGWRLDAGLSSNWSVNNTNSGYKSGYRTEAINEEVGGEWNSYHVRGCAADIHISGQNDSDRALSQTIIDAAKAWGLDKQLGIGLYGDWIHVDTRGYTSRW